jgi:hypothetical protein
VIADLADGLVSGPDRLQGPVVRGDGALPFPADELPFGGYDVVMEPRTRDVVGAALLALVLIGLVVILVAANVPHH